MEACANTTHPFCIRMKNGTIFMSWMSDGMANGLDESEFDLISEYVEPTVTDTFRRDLIARIYVARIAEFAGLDNEIIRESIAYTAIECADTLIERLGGEP